MRRPRSHDARLMRRRRFLLPPSPSLFHCGRGRTHPVPKDEAGGDEAEVETQSHTPAAAPDRVRRSSPNALARAATRAPQPAPRANLASWHMRKDPAGAGALAGLRPPEARSR